jgi:hypothetical protein
MLGFALSADRQAHRATAFLFIKQMGDFAHRATSSFAGKEEARNLGQKLRLSVECCPVLQPTQELTPG